MTAPAVSITPRPVAPSRTISATVLLEMIFSATVALMETATPTPPKARLSATAPAAALICAVLSARTSTPAAVISAAFSMAARVVPATSLSTPTPEPESATPTAPAARAPAPAKTRELIA